MTKTPEKKLMWPLNFTNLEKRNMNKKTAQFQKNNCVFSGNDSKFRFVRRPQNLKKSPTFFSNIHSKT